MFPMKGILSNNPVNNPIIIPIPANTAITSALSAKKFTTADTMFPSAVTKPLAILDSVEPRLEELIFGQVIIRAHT